MILFIFFVVAIVLLIYGIKKYKLLSQKPVTSETTQMESSMDGCDDSFIKPQSVTLHQSYKRDDSIDNFLSYWLNVDSNDYDFKKKPTKEYCLNVFNDLEKDGYNFKEIYENDEIVISKFRQLHPHIMNTLLEKEIKEELEFFLEDCRTWDGLLEDIRSKLKKKPTQKQLKEVFYSLINNGVKPTDIMYSDQKIYIKLIELFPELKK